MTWMPFAISGPRWRLIVYWTICCRTLFSALEPFQIKLSMMLPSLKRRNSALSPQNFRNAAAACLSSAEGPLSIARLTCSELIRSPIATLGSVAVDILSKAVAQAGHLLRIGYMTSTRSPSAISSALYASWQNCWSLSIQSGSLDFGIHVWLMDRLGMF